MILHKLFIPIEGNYELPEYKIFENMYINVLNLAKENNCKSIAIPVIVPNKRYSLIDAWEFAIRACKEWIENNDDFAIKIVFADPVKDIIDTGRKALQKQKKKAA